MSHAAEQARCKMTSQREAEESVQGVHKVRTEVSRVSDISRLLSSGLSLMQIDASISWNVLCSNENSANE